MTALRAGGEGRGEMNGIHLSRHARRFAAPVREWPGPGAHADRREGHALYVASAAANPSLGVVAMPDGGLIAKAGTFLYGADAGETALQRFYQQFDGTGRALADTAGHFLLVISRGDRIWVLRDRNGAYEAYAAVDGSGVSTSFLALAAELPRRTINRQAAYEYVFDGVTLGDDTPLAEIRKLGIDEMLVWENGWRSSRSGWPLLAAAQPRDRDAALAGILDALTGLVQRAVGVCSGNARVALSGGYDSRLIVALILRAGFTPDLYVYGGAESSDVRIAQTIADAEGLPLAHHDKETGVLPPCDAFPAIVAHNHAVGDGYPWGGIFGSGVEHAARAARHAGGALLLNGGGGEVLRNFFNLLDRPIRAVDLARCFYSQFDPRACADGFSMRAHLGNIADKIRRLPGFDRDPLSRQQAEAVYPHFRCRSWNGRESTINSSFGPWLLPFYDYDITQAALALPVAWKHFGNFEAALIRRAHPRLAAFPTNYGHGFDRDAPLARRARTMVDVLQPPWLRQHRFAIKHRFAARRGFSPLLGPDYAGRVIDLKLPYMSRLFRIERIVSEAQYSRILTLEHLYQSLNATGHG
jgi:hypothetical protein